MKLKSKIILVSIISVILFCIIGFILQKTYVLPTYKGIEIAEAGKDLCEAVDSLKFEEKKIEELGFEIVKLLKSNKQLFTTELPSSINSKIVEILDRNNLNFCAAFTDKLQLNWIENLNIQKNKIPFIHNNISKYNLLFEVNSIGNHLKTGLIQTSLGIILISSIPITNEAKTIGTLIIGLQLNSAFIENFSKKINIPVDLISMSDKSNLEKLNKSISRVDKDYTIYYNPIIDNSDYLKSFVILPDINSNPAFILSITLSRAVYREAYGMIDFALYSLLIFGIILILITAFLIHILVVKPISGLTESTISIRKSEDLKLRTQYGTRGDEVGHLSREFNNLLNQVEQYIENIRLTREDTIFRISMAIDSKDSKTGSHITRVSKMVKVLAYKLGLDEEKCEVYAVASTMHDIGKIGVPETVLYKEGKYTEEEFNEMKAHTIVGGKIFADGNSKLLNTAHDIALYHHERWDGTGYPEGKKQEEIPLSARITSVVDVFDALLSKKSYKIAYSLEDTINFIDNNKGSMFDPGIVEIFIKNIDDFIDIRDQYLDADNS